MQLLACFLFNACVVGALQQQHSSRGDKAASSDLRSFIKIEPKNRKTNFDSCTAVQRAVELSSNDLRTSTPISVECNGVPGPCTCPNHELLLYSFANSKVEQSCCKNDKLSISNLHCSGCTQSRNIECDKCLGGFTKMGKECVLCSNENSFMDEDGNTCATYSANKWCSKGNATSGFELKVMKKYQHLSAAEACCVCGGGHHRGTPFQYVVTRAGGVGLIGEPFKAFPRPRTANKYIIDPSCRLADYGLTIDSNTGVISGTPTVLEPLEFPCTITARSRKIGFQDNVFNGPYREYNTTIVISVKAFALRPSYPFISGNPVEYQNDIVDTMVFDQDSIYKTYKVKWSPNIPARKSNFAFNCSIRSKFLKLRSDQSGVHLGFKEKVTPEDYRRYSDEKAGGVRATNHDLPHFALDGLMKTMCHLSAIDETGVVRSLDIKVFFYPYRPNSTVDFAPTSALRVTIGQPVINKLELGYPYDSGKKVVPIAGLYGVRAECTSDISQKPVYDTTTGNVLIEGLPVFNIHPVTGTVSGSPHIGLRQFMPATVRRSSFDVKCDVYAAIPSAEDDQQVLLLKTAHKLVLQVNSDHCWIQAKGFKTPEGWVARLKGNSLNMTNTEKCKTNCSESLSCAGYQYLSNQCYNLVLALNTTNLDPHLGLKKDGTGAFLKVDNCQLHQTCVSIDITNQAYLSGLYCPVLNEIKTPAQPLYMKPGFHEADTFYLTPLNKDKSIKLPSGCTFNDTVWVIRKSSAKGDDIMDAEKNYIELHGTVEACITTNLLSAPKGPTSLLSIFDMQSNGKAHVKTFSSVVANGKNSSGVVFEGSMLSIVQQSKDLRVNPHLVYDSIPQANTWAFVDGKKSSMEIIPMGKSCESPISAELREKQESSSEDNNGVEEASKNDKADVEKQLGLVKGNAVDVVKSLIFKFDDPTTTTDFDYHLDVCQCFFEEWGDGLPVSNEAYETALVGSLNPGMSFNRFIPEPFKLWVGPHVCDHRFLLYLEYDVDSCSLECGKNPNCKYFIESEEKKGKSCMLYSDCQLMTRPNTDYKFITYAMFKPPGLERLCHIADPSECWANTRRRAYLSNKLHPYGECMWGDLIEQCDFAKLLGDTDIESCGICTYMSVESQQVKRRMPVLFPHGSTLITSCAVGYSLITNNNVGQVTCIDGIWRDEKGDIGLTNLQCSECIQIFDNKTKGLEMSGANLQELVFIGKRSISLFILHSSNVPQWIEVENTSMLLRTGHNRTNFSWKISLERTTSMQLMDFNSKQCLGIYDYPMEDTAALAALSLQRCQKQPTKNPTEQPSSFSTNFPTGSAKIMLWPNDVFARIAKQDDIVRSNMTEEGFWCDNHQFLKAVNWPTACVKLARSASDAATQVQRATNYIVKIECPKGSAAYDLRRNTASNNYTMKCNSLPALGRCERLEFQTHWHPEKNMDIYDIFYYTVRAPDDITCPAQYIFAGLETETSSKNKILKIKIKCCLFSSFSGIKVSSNTLNGFEQYEGMYCPKQYDDLLRPRFRQKIAFGVSNHPPMSATGGSAMSPTNYHTPRFLFDKRTNEWCLISRSTYCSSPHGDVDHPLDIDWLSERAFDTRFSIVPILPLEGEGMTGSMNHITARNPLTPKRPSLIKFTTTEPETNKGCQFIQEDNFKGAEEQFSRKHQTHPCLNVAEATWKIRAKHDRGPGITVEDAKNCGERAIGRRWELARVGYGLDTASETAKFINNLATRAFCSATFEPESGAVTGVKFGMSIQIPEICTKTADRVNLAFDYVTQFPKFSHKWFLDAENNEDCGEVKSGLNRMMCDLFCLRESIHQSTISTLTSIKDSNNNILSNADMLMEYYSQVVMNHAEVEVVKAMPKYMQLSESAYPNAVSQRLSTTLAKYLTPSYLLRLPADKVDGSGALVTEEAHSQTASILDKTIDILRHCSSSKEAGKVISRALIKIERILLPAHIRATRIQNRGSPAEGGAETLKARINNQANVINVSLAYKDISSMICRQGLHLLKNRASNIVKDIAEVRGSHVLTKEGALALKLDMLSDDVKQLRVSTEMRYFLKSMAKLANHWSDIHLHTSSYLTKSDQLVEETRMVLADINSYTECGMNTLDKDFILKRAARFNNLKDSSRSILMQLWPKVLHAVTDHMNILYIHSVLQRSIRAAAASVSISYNLRLHNNSLAEILFTSKAVSDVGVKLAASVDLLPHTIILQSFQILNAASFLHSRMSEDDGETPNKENTYQLISAFETLVSATNSQLKFLANTRAGLVLISDILDTVAVKSFPAPSECKELAFERFSEPLTASLVTMTRTKSGMYIVTQPLSQLMFQDRDFSIEVSNAFTTQDFPMRFPMSLVLSTYLCKEEKDGHFTIQKSSNLPVGEGVVFCSGMGCDKSIELNAHIVIRIPTYKQASRAVKVLRSSKLAAFIDLQSIPRN